MKKYIVLTIVLTLIFIFSNISWWRTSDLKNQEIDNLQSDWSATYQIEQYRLGAEIFGLYNKISTLENELAEVSRDRDFYKAYAENVSTRMVYVREYHYTQNVTTIELRLPEYHPRDFLTVKELTKVLFDSTSLPLFNLGDITDNRPPDCDNYARQAQQYAGTRGLYLNLCIVGESKYNEIFGKGIRVFLPGEEHMVVMALVNNVTWYADYFFPVMNPDNTVYSSQHWLIVEGESLD